MHSNRKTGEHRRHPSIWPNGTAIGMMTVNGMATGHVNHMDAGGWIYPVWKDRKNSTLPSYCRSTQVIRLKEKKDAA